MSRVLIIFLIFLGVLLVESRHHPDSTQVVHRHRHRHEPSSRWHHNYPRRSWTEDEDYQDADDELDEDYDLESYDRTYSPKKNHRFDSRHSRKHYHGNHHGTKFAERRRNFGTRNYGGTREWNHRICPSRDRTYRKGGPSWEYDDEDEVDYFEDYDKFSRYDDDKDDLSENDEYYSGRRSSRKHRVDEYDNQDSKDQRSRLDSRRDWKSKNSIRKDDRRDRRRKFGYRGVSRNRFYEDSDEDDVDEELAENRRKNLRENGTGSLDYDDGPGDLFDDEEDEDEEGRNPKDQFKEEKSESDGSDELDNDFYKNDAKPPLKTYDDIIRRLTAEDPTTPKSTVRRDYRNIEIGKHLMKDAYGNLKYDSKNISRFSLDLVTVSSSGATTTTAKSVIVVKGSNEDKSKHSVGQGDDSGGNERKIVPEVVNSQGKVKSVDQEYDYGEQEDDPSAQADGNTADYAEEESEEEDESITIPTTTTSTTPPTTTTTTTSTTTTTTKKPFVDEHSYHKDARAYEGSTGSQYNGYQSKNDYPPMSAHSIHKWQTLGSRKSVKETRDKYPELRNNGKSAEVKEALQHAIKVSREGSCQWPRARVVPVRDVYPSTSTTYIPHCAILHRCSDDTGCCRSEALTCVPKHSHRVELYFYTTNLEGGSVVEKLNFYNHTECECRERSGLDSKTEKPSETRVTRQHPSSSPENLWRPPQSKPCRCPSEFIPRTTPDGKCQCKCSDNDQNCIRTRRGKGYFSIKDRLCIQHGDCSAPICEFGEYMSRQGKCPRRQDISAFPTYHTDLHHGFRS